MSSLDIRPLDKNNVEKAIDLAVRIFGENQASVIENELKAALGIEPFRSTATKNMLLDQIEYFIGYVGDEMIGITGNYTIVDHPKDLWLGWTGILPEHQGLKYGQKLISHAFSAHETTDIETLRIWTTLSPIYDGARHVYNTMGFSEEIYEPSAEDAAKMIVVFSKSLKNAPAEEFLWEYTGYPMDCEGFEIGYLNKKMGLEQDVSPMTPKKNPFNDAAERKSPDSLPPPVAPKSPTPPTPPTP